MFFRRGDPGPARRPRRARHRPGAFDRHRRAAPARHHPRGLGRAPRKGLAASGRASRMDADRRRGADSVSRRARSRRRRSRRPRDAARNQERALRRRSSMAFCAISRAGARRFVADSDPLDQDTPPWLAARWRKTYGEELARAIASANRDEPTLDLTVKSDPAVWAEAAWRALVCRPVRCGSRRTADHGARWLRGRRMVGAGRGGGFAGAAARRRTRRQSRRFLRGSRRQGRAARDAGAEVTAIDRSAERLKRLAANFERLQSPRRRHRRRYRRASRRRPSMRSCSMRPVSRPGRSAVTPISPGPRSRATSRHWPRCRRACSTRRSNW